MSALRNEYVATPKPDKSYFARVVVKHIRSLDPPGRFLKRASDKDLFINVGEKLACLKTSQALREGKPGIDRKIKSGELIIEEVSLLVVSIYTVFGL